MLNRREVQLRACGKVEGPVRALGDPFQAAKEVEFVSHDRSAERASPLFERALGFVLIVQPGEVVLRRERRVGEVPEHDAPELIRTLFGDGVDHRAGRSPELRVVLVCQHLELLDGFERRPRLAANAAAERVIGVVAAVEGHVVALSRLAAGDKCVVAELVRW